MERKKMPHDGVMSVRPRVMRWRFCRVMGRDGRRGGGQPLSSWIPDQEEEGGGV